MSFVTVIDKNYEHHSPFPSTRTRLIQNAIDLPRQLYSPLLPPFCSTYLWKMKKSNTLQTIDAYDKNAEKYADKFDNYKIYREKILDFQRKYIPGGAKILDLGCGPGNNIKWILDQDASCFFTGVDLSTGLMNIAKKRFPQFTFLRQDIRRLELRSQFEIVIASFCIVHLTDEETIDLLRTISDLITDNGHLYLSYMNGETSGLESTSFSKEKIFFNYYSDRFIIEGLEQNHFNVLDISKEQYIEPDGSVTTDTFIYAMKDI